MFRIISIVTALLLFITTVPIHHTYANGDITKPVLESIQVDKKDATAGDTVNVSVKASDDVGISWISLTYSSAISKRVMYVPVHYNSETNAYEGNISIPENFEYGTFEVYNLTISDTTGNSNTYGVATSTRSQVAAGDFTVSGTTGIDSQNPVLESITVDKKEATIFDTVNVKIKATDDIGTNAVSLTYQWPYSKGDMEVPMNYNPQTDTYEGSIHISSNTEYGAFKVKDLTIYDISGNSQTYTSDSDPENQLAAGEFSIKTLNGADVQKPALESLSIDTQTANIGETVKVSIKAWDDVKVGSITLNYQTPIYQSVLNVPMTFNSEMNAFEGNIQITDKFEPGIYRISKLLIEDSSGNTAYYSSNSNGDFKVITEKNPPSLIRFSGGGGAMAEPGDTVGISVEATDDTQVQEAYFHYLTPSQKPVSVGLWWDGVGLSSEGLHLENDAEPGKWTLDSIEIKDINENTTIIKASDRDLSSGDFTVLKPITPLSSYIVKSTESWSNKTINSDVYILPGARLTISSNVTINGNVYVLGGLRSTGGLRVSGSVIANSITFGYYTPANGQAIFTGSNSISGMVATNRIIDKVPFTLYDTPLVRSGGKVSLSGATLPFVAMEINGQSTSLRDNGTFRLNDFYIGISDTLSVKLTDLSGNSYYYSYEVAEIYVDDFTKNSQTITGKTAADSSVRILENDSVIGNGTADDQGYFSIPVSNLAENTKLTFEVRDSNNQLLTSKDIFVRDITAPEKPVMNALTDKSTAISGRAEAESTVVVKKNGLEIGTLVTLVDGTFTIDIPLQKAGSELSITAADKAGNVSEAATVVVEDATAPDIPVVKDVKENATTVTGSAEPGAKIEVAVQDEIIGEGTVDESGKFIVSIPAQKLGTSLTVTAVDSAGNRSEASTVIVKDGTAPEKPIVDEVTDQDLKVTGKAEAGSTVFIRDKEGNVLGTAVTESDGTFTVPLMNAPKAGAELSVTLADHDENVSEPAIVIVKDVTAPGKPAVNEVTDKDTAVTGHAEAGTKVAVSAAGEMIGSGLAEDDGHFSVTIPVQPAETTLKITAADKAGNVSEDTFVVVKDVTGPGKPVVNEVTDKDGAVTGSAEAGSLVEIWNGTRVIGFDDADQGGSFTAAIPVQTAGTKLTITAKDTARNVSEATAVIVKDVTAPSRPVVTEATDAANIVIGTAEPGSKVEVSKEGSVIGNAVAGADGSFTVQLSTSVKAGTTLSVTATDKAGNVSEASVVIVKDVINPSDLSIHEVTDKDDAVTGYSEPGTKVIVSLLVDGTVIGSGIADEDGVFSVKIPVQQAGTSLLIYALDEAGNRSNSSIVTVQDVTIPAMPVVNEVSDQDYVVRGTAEPNTTVEVRVNGSLLGSDFVRGDGSFGVRITEQKAGTELMVTVTDRVGHVSEAAKVVVKDGIPPEQAIVNAVSNRDTIVTGQAEANARVEVKNSEGTLLGAASAGLDGKFAVTIPVQSYGSQLLITVVDAAGNVSHAVSVTVDIAKLAGWYKENGFWYYYDPVRYDLQLGWFKVGSSWFYADGYGKMQTGWQKLGPAWYYFGTSGVMATGWVKVGTTWYFFGSSGAMQTGWMKSGSTWYYFGTSGAMKVGWLQSGSTWYYFMSSGAMATGWIKIGGKSYYFDKNGVWRK